ncbi:MAG: FHA domain-containing protein [Fimbriimonadaceae bacterium]|nr:FHA domain-containing protein [Fimbriimonadaceae bacterium]
MGKIFLTMLAGAAAGLVAWLIWEPQFPASVASAQWGEVEQRFIATLGALVGLAVGASRGWMQGSKVHMLRGAGVGLVLGIVGGLLGYSIGGGLVNSIFGPTIFMGTEPLTKVMLARMIAFAPFGLMLGASVGAAALSTRQVVVGLIGGALGAGLGAAIFDVLGAALGPTIQAAKGGDEVGGVSRAVTAVLIGGGIGLFTALLERATRQAWVRLVLGRNEGKEWLIDAPQTFLGRSERAHVPLFGDPNVMPMHASIVRQGPNYVLVDGGSPMGTGLNGQRVGQAHLNSGDMIQIGTNNLQFMLRSGRPVQNPGVERFQPQPIPATPQGIVVGGQPVAPMGATMTMPVAASMPTPSVKAPVLVALSGPLSGQRFDVSGPIEVGRECSVIPMSFDTMASRRHAALTPGPAGLVVSDLNSTNGTLVNGQKVKSHVLKTGDTLQVGSTTFRVE